MNLRSRRRAARRGSTMIEFAFVTFLLMIVIFASFEFDRMLLVYTTMANAARAGARYAIVHGSYRTGTGDPPSGATDNSTVVAKVKSFASAGPLNVNNVNVLVEYPAASVSNPSGNSPGSLVIVTVSYPYDAFTLLPLGVSLRSTSRGIIVF
jgi:Flp pilus assembly protein TadG